MDLFWCWLVAPLALLLVTIGLSLLVERVADVGLPWTVRPALGLAAAIVLAQFGTAADATAELTVPAILVLAAIGLIVGWGRSDEGIPRAAALAGAVVFGLYAAPIVLSGEATWAGFIKLDDTATWMAITDHAFEFGRGVGELESSTHAATIDAYLGGSYPIGGFVAAAVMSVASGQDLAFTMQPSMAFAAGALGLLVFELVRPVVRGGIIPGLIAIVAPISAVLFGYVLWGGVKEIVSAALLALGPALAAHAARNEWRRAYFVPVAVAVAALIGVLGPGGAVWVIPTLIPALVLLWRGVGTRLAWRFAWPVAALSLVLALPVLITPDGLFDPVDASLTEASELGNLDGPLNPLHAAGLWPALDFRSTPHLEPAVLVLAATCLLAAACAVVACWRLPSGRGAALVGFAGGGAVGAAAIMLVGSPWVDGKAMATVSPALLAATLAGFAMLGQRTGFRIEAAVGGVVVAGVVAWSAFLAYQGTWLAPRDHQVELEEIGEEFEGQGPALSTEVSIYGPRHFLRKLDAEGATDLRPRLVLLAGGQRSVDGTYVDIDQIQGDQLYPYNLIITRRSPSASRPPAGFVPAKTTDHYTVWRRAGGGGPLARLPLGEGDDPGAVPSCDDVRELADRAGESGRLFAAHVADPVIVELGSASRPASWGAPSATTVEPNGDGTLTTAVELQGGSYELWLGGVVFGSVEILIDGETVATESGRLNQPGGMEPLGVVELAGGSRTVELRYEQGGLTPGSAEHSYAIGPLILEPVRQVDLGRVEVAAADYRQLCDQRWDWIESYP